MLTAKLIKIANELDRRRLIREADYLDRIIRLAQSKGSRSDLKILLKKFLRTMVILLVTILEKQTCTLTLKATPGAS